MGFLRSTLSNLQSSPYLFKAPPYVSLLCILGGIIWVLLLPLQQYSRGTYISENALLPGQVHTYFHSTEQDVFRAYRHEIGQVLEPQVFARDDQTQYTVNATIKQQHERIRAILQNTGIRTATQKYKYSVGGQDYAGENVYGVIHAPRGDGTEAMVLLAPKMNVEEENNANGVTLLLTLARYFSRWSLWSKDIILLVTPDTSAGPQAWIDAYLSQHDPGTVDSLSLKSGTIQGVICIDFPFRHSFHALQISYDGINGQLPNLDLINTAIQISQSQSGIPTLLQKQHLYAKPERQHHYLNRLTVLGHGMRNQAAGLSTGAHSVFMPYHIDAITLTATGDGWEDEMAFGRVVESLVRSLNNLLEKLHQSFFFFLLLQNNRFISIGTYLPSAMAVGASFSIMAIYLWLKSGYQEREETKKQYKAADERDDGTRDRTEEALADPTIDTADLLKGSSSEAGIDLSRKSEWKSVSRQLALPIAMLSGLYAASLVPIAILTHAANDKILSRLVSVFFVIFMAPVGLGFVLVNNDLIEQAPTNSFAAKHQSKSDQGERIPTNVERGRRAIVQHPPTHLTARVTQFHTVLKALSLLVLGLQITVLATLNFSLSMFLGILCTPCAFAGFYPKSEIRAKASLGSLIVFSPHTVAIAAVVVAKMSGHYNDDVSMAQVLRLWSQDVSFFWNVSGSWGILVGLFCVWTPAWIVATVGALSSFLVDLNGRSAEDTQKSTSKTQHGVTDTGSVVGGDTANIKRIVENGATRTSSPKGSIRSKKKR